MHFINFIICSKFTYNLVPIEQFTDCIRVVFEKLEHARRAKRLADAKNFYGGILHISYAPEYESIDELAAKLQQRRAEVQYRLRKNAIDFGRSTTAKRKADEMHTQNTHVKIAK